MKRVVLILAASVIGSLLVCSMMSCKEKEGVYSPEKGKGKISKVYYEIKRIYSTRTDISIPKHLIEVWKWDKNKLMQIESKDEKGQPWALNFIYKGKQVTNIESGDVEFKFSYEDKDTKLKKIEVIDEEKRPMLNITVDSRSGDKISKLTYEQFNYIETPDGQSLLSKMRPVMNIMLGDNVGEVMLKNVESNVKMQKATKTVKITTQVELTYEGNNVSEEKRTIIMENIAPQTEIVRYKYDNKSNPYYQAFCMIFDGFYNTTSGNPSVNAYFATFSENNIVSYFKYIPTDDPKKPEITVDSAEYIYKYNGDNFPTERDRATYIIINTDTARNHMEHIIYSYEYITK